MCAHVRAERARAHLCLRRLRCRKALHRLLDQAAPQADGRLFSEVFARVDAAGLDDVRLTEVRREQLEHIGRADEFFTYGDEVSAHALCARRVGGQQVLARNMQPTRS